jgi:hypothetical protein
LAPRTLAVAPTFGPTGFSDVRLPSHMTQDPRDALAGTVLPSFPPLPSFHRRPWWDFPALPAIIALFVPLLHSLLSSSSSHRIRLRFRISSARRSPLLFRVNLLRLFYLLSVLPRFCPRNPFQIYDMINRSNNDHTILMRPLRPDYNERDER